jgi:putative transposase
VATIVRTSSSRRGDRYLLTGILSKFIERISAKVHAYCYMTNHIHLLIQVSDTPLSKIMLHVAGRYARSVQARFETTGHLFEKRYHALLVDADEYLLALLRYIHLNPVRASLTSSPDDYPWSSHHSYLGAREEVWITTDFALRMFDADRDRAISAYSAFMSHAPTSSPLLDRNARDPRILGSDAFAYKLLGKEWHPPSSGTLRQLVDDACARFAVTTSELQSPSRLAHLVRARAWVAEQAVSTRIASLASVARYFNRDASSLRHTVSRRRSRG